MGAGNTRPEAATPPAATTPAPAPADSNKAKFDEYNPRNPRKGKQPGGGNKIKWADYDLERHFLAEQEDDGRKKKKQTRQLDEKVFAARCAPQYTRNRP
jgi:hypothetical protein